MSTVAISGLPAATAVTTADLIPIVQGGTTKKISIGTAFSIPPPIGNTTPSTGAFTTLSATGAVSFSTTLAVTQTVTAASFVTGGSGGPTWTSGAGVPASTQPKGSLYSRTGGGVGSTLYVTQGGGVWNAVAGV